MNKIVIFDLDGVLIDSKNIHFDALNKALTLIDASYVITAKEQETIYEGLPTNQKLQMLTKYKKLPVTLYNQISKDKQAFTKEMLNNTIIDSELIYFFKLIKSKNFKIAVASNSIRETIDICLSKLGISELVDYVLSNEDVKYPKPHPEIYWKAMAYFGSLPEETVIFEDSFVGQLAAQDSNANLIKIKNRKDLNIDKINHAIKILDNVKSSWKNSELNVLIPMAGAGSRFTEAGYIFPKPLIEVNGNPMIQEVINSLSINAKYIYVVKKEHFEQYHLDYLLKAITPNYEIIQVNETTDGAAITALMAKDFIDNDNPLIIANSDQIVDWNSREFIYELYSKNADGGIALFESNHPKWSYVKIDDFNVISEVAEKKPISNNATVGIYYWKRGSDFVKYAEQMIDKNIRTNDEFYICPVYNEAILDNKKIYGIYVKNMWGIGTPEDLNYYLYKNND